LERNHDGTFVVLKLPCLGKHAIFEEEPEAQDLVRRLRLAVEAAAMGNPAYQTYRRAARQVEGAVESVAQLAGEHRALVDQRNELLVATSGEGADLLRLSDLGKRLDEAAERLGKARAAAAELRRRAASVKDQAEAAIHRLLLDSAPAVVAAAQERQARLVAEAGAAAAPVLDSWKRLTLTVGAFGNHRGEALVGLVPDLPDLEPKAPAPGPQQADAAGEEAPLISPENAGGWQSLLNRG
jgi:hypothetical protein